MVSNSVAISDDTIVAIYTALASVAFDPNSPLAGPVAYSTATLRDIKYTLRQLGFSVIPTSRMGHVECHKTLASEQLRSAEGLREHIQRGQAAGIGQEMYRVGAILFEDVKVPGDHWDERTLMRATARVIIPKAEDEI